MLYTLENMPANIAIIRRGPNSREKMLYHEETGNTQTINLAANPAAMHYAIRSFVTTISNGNTNCTNCHGCKDCHGCINCMNCNDCKNCTHCKDLSNCTSCVECKHCTNCTDCYQCYNCVNCTDCAHCQKQYTNETENKNA